MSCASILPTLARGSRKLVVTLLMFAVAGAAHAAKIEVTSAGDTDPNATGTCTLRQAILSMNRRVLVGNCVNIGEVFGNRDTITIAASTFGVHGAALITLVDSADVSGDTGGQLVVSAHNVTIDGAAPTVSMPARRLVVQRDANAVNAFRILDVTTPAGGKLKLENLVIRNGNVAPSNPATGYSGGGVRSVAADVDVDHCDFTNNAATNDGGGIYASGAQLSIRNSSFSGNFGGEGGALAAYGSEVSIVDSELDGNTGEVLGGGLFAVNEATVNVVRSRITNNRLDDVINGNGGGIFVDGNLSLVDSTVANNDARMVGGILVSVNTSPVIIRGSTINGNTGVESVGGVSVSGGLDIDNSTISGNAARIGGIQAGHLDMSRTTVSLNHSFAGNGIIAVTSATIEQSIVADNFVGEADQIVASDGWSGDYNILSTAGLLLAPLADNGGPTQTMRPDVLSMALDKIPRALCIGLKDQRGVVRPQGMKCDIGAFELESDILFEDGFEQ